MKTLSHNVCQKFIQKQIKLNLNIIESLWIAYSYNKRNILYYSNDLINKINKINTIAPIYIMLNLKSSQQDDKHASLIIINNNTRKVYIFNPNGTIYTLVDKNIMGIAQQLSIKYNYEVINLMKNRKNLNKDENCNAICLYFITKTSTLNYDDVLNDMELKNTSDILNVIT